VYDYSTYWSASVTEEVRPDNMVATICDNFNFDATIHKEAQELFAHATNKVRRNRRYTDMDYAAYAVYHALRKAAVPISGKDVFNMTMFHYPEYGR